MKIRIFSSCAALALGLLIVPSVARADVSVEAGALDTHYGTSFGGGVSLGLFGVPLAPINGEVTVLTSTNGGGTAGTLDLRAHLAGTTVGAGIGVGNMGATSNTSVIYDVILAQSILPHIAIEGREYLGPQRPSSFFAGLRLSL